MACFVLIRLRNISKSKGGAEKVVQVWKWTGCRGRCLLAETSILNPLIYITLVFFCFVFFLTSVCAEDSQACWPSSLGDAQLWWLIWDLLCLAMHVSRVHLKKTFKKSEWFWLEIVGTWWWECSTNGKHLLWWNSVIICLPRVQKKLQHFDIYFCNRNLIYQRQLMCLRCLLLIWNSSQPVICWCATCTDLH